MVKDIYEFLVWDNCNNNCKFCFLRKNPRLFTLNELLQILTDVLSYIKSYNFIFGSHILICGGELFDKIERFEMFDIFFAEIMQLMSNLTIDILYINTNLIYKEENVLKVCELLLLFRNHNLISRVRFATSYDLEGRFTILTHLMFLSNLDIVSKAFPEVTIVANVILTLLFCNAILDLKFDIFKFMQTYNCKINLIPYIILGYELAPSRSLVFATLNKLYTQDPEYIDSWTLNLGLKLLRKMFYVDKTSKDFIKCECMNSECGHSVNFKRYSMDNTCFVCDVTTLLLSLGGNRNL